jgi:DNA-3-methyladenine glycosylase II
VAAERAKRTDGPNAAPSRARKVSHREAARLLAERDPVLRQLVEAAGPPRFPRPTETHFAALVRSITHQQLAGAAAEAIHGRLVLALEGEVTPEKISVTPAPLLRAAGLSGNKVASVEDLAAKVLDGTVRLEPHQLARESDEAVVTRLTAVRGIGKWSAEIFLMFQLRRMDVWPTGDLGVRKGFGLAWSMPTPTPKALDVLGESFRPYRSVVAWYCWQAARLYAGTAPGGVTR